MRYIALSTVLVLILLSGCRTLGDTKTENGPSTYLGILEQRGRPDYVLEDNIARKRVLIYWNSSYIFNSDNMKLLEVRGEKAINFPYGGDSKIEDSKKRDGKNIKNSP